MTEEQEPTWTQGQVEFAARIMQASTSMTADINQRLIDHLQYQVDCLTAELEIVQERIYDLHSHPWIPQPRTVIAALTVHPDEVKRRVRNIEDERKADR